MIKKVERERVRYISNSYIIYKNKFFFENLSQIYSTIREAFIAINNIKYIKRLIFYRMGRN